jgi:hypothetical protein
MLLNPIAKVAAAVPGGRRAGAGPAGPRSLILDADAAACYTASGDSVRPGKTFKGLPDATDSLATVRTIDDGQRGAG